MTDTPAATPLPADTGHIVVCGLGRFGLRIVQTLRERGAEVVIITDTATRADRKAHALALGAYVVEGDFRFADVRLAARVDEAHAFVLAASDDRANLEAALDVRREFPGTRIVMRLDADAVAARLEADFGIAAVLSPAVLAAARFADAALEEAPAAPVSPDATPRRPLSSRLTRRPRTTRPFPALIGLCVILVFLSGVIVFHHTLALTWVDAIYFTASILTTVGFGDFALRESSDAVKLFGTFLMFGGVTLIAVFSSFLTNFYVSGAATQLRAERGAGRLRNHVILCGLGSVGFEIAEALTARRIPLVIIDGTAGGIHARSLPAHVPYLAGDATQSETLVRAGIGRARAVIAATSNDAVNLEIGLIAQTLATGSGRVRRGAGGQPLALRLVLRCFDPDLARRIHAVSDAYTLLSSAEIAAPLFADTALRR